MKLMKKVLAGALSVAVVLGAMFAFTGCNSVRNKTYEIETWTVTVVKAVDEDGKVTETQTLTAREAFIYEICGDLDKIASYTLSPEEEKAYNDMLDDMKKYAPKAVFGKDTVENITEMKNELTGIVERHVQVAEYEVDGDIITVTAKMDANELENDLEFVVYTLEIVDGKIHQKQYEEDDVDHVWEKGDVYYTTMIYAQVK